MTPVRIVAAGDAVLVAEFEDRVDPGVNARAVSLAGLLRADRIVGVRDIVPTFRSVAVYFDPLSTDLARLEARMRETASQADDAPADVSECIDIPVCYDAEFGTDLREIADARGLSVADVITLHSIATYRVYMLGFAPGFAYLGTVDSRIATPRRSSPRVLVSAGSVGIAGELTGVYPSSTPGGWNIVGRTPVRMLSFERAVPSLLNAGDSVRFHPIDRREFDRIAAAQERTA